MRIAALIGVSLVGGFLGGMAMRGAASIMMGSEAAAETMGIGTMVTSRAIGIATETAVTTAGQTAVFGGSLKDNFLENMIMSLGTSGVMKMIGERAGEAMKIEKAVGGMWSKAAYGGKVFLAESAVITGHTIMGAAMGYVAHKIVTGETQPPPATLEEWMLQGASIAVGRYVGHAISAHSEARRKLAGAGIEGAPKLVSEADKLVALAKQAEQNPQAKDAMDLLVKRHEVLSEELKVLEELEKSPAKMKAVNISSRELAKTKTELKGQLAESHSQGYAEVALHTSGMHELIPGALWSGTEADVAEMIAKAKGAGIDASAVKDPQGGKWKVKIGDKDVIVEERAPQARNNAPHDAPRGKQSESDTQSRAAGAVPQSQFDGKGANRRHIHQEEVTEALKSAVLIVQDPKGLQHFTMSPDGKAVWVSVGPEWAQINIDIDDTGHDVARHTYEHGKSRAHIIVSETARPEDLVRAVGHELVEIRALMENSARKLSDSPAMQKDPTTDIPSHHDLGRQAEIKVLLYERKNQPGRQAEIDTELRALVKHLGFEFDTLETNERARKLLGNDTVNALSQLTQRKRIPVAITDETVKTKGYITPNKKEWRFDVTAVVPGLKDPALLGHGYVLLDANGLPESGPSFSLDKRVTVGDQPGRVDLMEHGKAVPLTQFALTKMNEAFTQQFGHEPHELPGSLADDNKEIFQRAYLKYVDKGNSPADAARLAADETPFVKNRKDFGYRHIEVKPYPKTEQIVYGYPPRLREVPEGASIVARRQ